MRNQYQDTARFCGGSADNRLYLIEKIVALKDTYIGMCRESYLPDDMEERFESLICERITALRKNKAPIEIYS